MDWTGSMESPQTDEEDLMSKIAATDIAESMEKSKEFWGEEDYEDVTIIPANLLKCPPNFNEYNVTAASELAHRAWETMSQNDFEEMARINEDLLTNGEIATNNLIPIIDSILKKTLDASKIKLALCNIDSDERQAIILVANQLLFIFEENTPPRIVEDDLEMNQNGKEKPPNSGNKIVKNSPNGDIKARIQNLLDIALESGLGEIKVPKNAYTNDRAKLAILEHQVRGRIRLKHILETGTRNPANKTTADDIKTRTILPVSNKPIKKNKKIDLNKRLKNTKAMRKTLKAQSNITDRGDKENNTDMRQVQSLNLPSCSVDNVFKPDEASKSQNELLNMPNIIEKHEEERMSEIKIYENIKTESSPSFKPQYDDLQVDSNISVEISSESSKNLSPTNLNESALSNNSEYDNDTTLKIGLAECSFKDNEEINEKRSHANFLREHSQFFNINKPEKYVYELNLDNVNLKEFSSSDTADLKSDNLSRSSICDKGLSVPKNKTVIKLEHNLADEVQYKRKLSAEEIEDIAKHTEDNKELIEPINEASSNHEMQKYNLNEVPSTLVRNNSGDTELIGTESFGNQNSTADSINLLKNNENSQLKFFNESCSPGGDLTLVTSSPTNIDEVINESLVQSISDVENPRDLRIILRETMSKVHEKTIFFLSRSLNKSSSSVENDLNACSSENTNDLSDQECSKQVLDVMNEITNKIEQYSLTCLQTELSNSNSQNNKRELSISNFMDSLSDKSTSKDSGGDADSKNDFQFHYDIDDIIERNMFKEAAEIQKLEEQIYENIPESTDYTFGKQIEYRGSEKKTLEKNPISVSEENPDTPLGIKENSAELKFWTKKVQDIELEKQEFQMIKDIVDEYCSSASSKETEMKIEKQKFTKQNIDDKYLVSSNTSFESEITDDKILEEVVKTNYDEYSMPSTTSEETLSETEVEKQTPTERNMDNKHLLPTTSSYKEQMSDNERLDEIEPSQVLNDVEETDKNDDDNDDEDDDNDDDDDDEDHSDDVHEEVGESVSSLGINDEIGSNITNTGLLENKLKENAKKVEDKIDSKGKKRSTSGRADHSLLYITIFVGVFTATYFTEYGRQFFSNTVVGNLKSNAVCCLDRAINVMTALKLKLQNS